MTLSIHPSHPVLTSRQTLDGAGQTAGKKVQRAASGEEETGGTPSSLPVKNYPSASASVMDSNLAAAAASMARNTIQQKADVAVLAHISMLSRMLVNLVGVGTTSNAVA